MANVTNLMIGSSTGMMETTNTTNQYTDGEFNMTLNDVTTAAIGSEEDDSGAMYYAILDVLASYFYPIVVVGGILFNMLSLAVLLTPKMRRISISVYLTALAISDSLVLLLDFINNYFKFVLGIYAIGINDFLCTLYRFSFDIVFTFSAWLVVAISLERFIVVWFPLKAKVATSVRKSRLVIVALLVIVCIYKLYNFWAWQIVNGECDWKEGWSYFHTYLNMPLTFAAYSYIPVIMLLILNCSIIAKLWMAARKRSQLSGMANSTTNAEETQKLTITVLLISFGYMILTVPLSAYYTIQYADDQFIEMTPQMAMGEMIILLVGLTNHGINFFLYILSSNNFRQSLIHLLRLQKFITPKDSYHDKHSADRSNPSNAGKKYLFQRKASGKQTNLTNLAPESTNSHNSLSKTEVSSVVGSSTTSIVGSTISVSAELESEINKVIP